MSVELPKDADGREIPLDTEVLYDKDGKELRVKRIEFDPFNDVWRFVVQKGSLDLGTFYYRPEYVCLEKPTQPDSWKKLEEDLDKCIETDDTCLYYSESVICGKCTRPDSDGCGCTAAIFSDIKKRIRKLRGED